jgi:3-isopropylmalate/(R)-2-methylmalate dehydratase small subunit
LLAITVDDQTHSWLLENPGADVTIDLESTRITLPGGRTVTFSMDGFSRHCLLEGIDQLGFLSKQLGTIESFEETRSWKP